MNIKGHDYIFNENFSKGDLIALSRSDRKYAESPLLAGEVCRALSLGLLASGLRHFGLWARQLQIGRISILVVFQDRDCLKRIQKREQFLSRQC